MTITNKYKIHYYINYEKNKNLDLYAKIKLLDKINFIFAYKSKFLRNFVFLYSLFLISNQFSYLNQKNKPNFYLQINLNFILILNESYNNFF